MIAAIHELAEKKQEWMKESHILTAEYLQACNFHFENGILSHDKITPTSQKCLANMAEGMKWFVKWREELQEKDPGTRHALVNLARGFHLIVYNRVHRYCV